MAGWADTLSVADLVLMVGIAAVNLYLWLNLVSEVRRWRRRRSRFSLPRLQVQFLPPDRSPVPLLVTALGTGLTSVWMLIVLLPFL